MFKGTPRQKLQRALARKAPQSFLWMLDERLPSGLRQGSQRKGQLWRKDPEDSAQPILVGGLSTQKCQIYCTM